jgi:SecD/SecF fusion protein
MDGTGTRLWRKMTGANIGRQVAIVLDNRVYSAPVVQGEIPNGNSNISGNFTIDEAKDLANILKAGRMPVPTRIVEEVVVGPTLGKESINQGINSILIGFAVIILFMIAYYSNSGIVANIAVLLNVLLILGILVPLDAVLTLPGIAGLVLTIGMAVDANVLINERIKDELANGVPLYEAVGNGYDLASSSIWDANITTLIGGFVMAFFGSGPVKGFAYTLVIGIFTSLVTSVYVTRVITEWRLKSGAKINFTTSFSKGLFKNINYDFVSKRKLAYIGSSIVITLGIISLFVQGLDFGIDFKGGYTFIVASDKAINSDKLRDALTPVLGNKAPEVKSYGSAERFKVTTTYLIEDNAADAADKVEAQVLQGLKNPSLAGDKLIIESSSKVGPTIAQDIKTKSFTAVLIAMLGIFAYIWLRFRKWEYALGSTIAVVHDTMIIITVFSVFKNLLPFNLEVDQNFIAAILTIIGYSVNDNVVIFDRIRESIKDDGGKSDTTTIVNKALNYTFSRTVITATTVFVVVLILLVFGGETIRGLSFALLIGVITGTYSTIYIAVPFLIDAGKKELAKAAGRA